MHRLVFLACSAAILAQTSQQDPVPAKVQEYWRARNEARFEEAATKREEARELLLRAPVEVPQFGNQVQTVAQLFQNAGMTARARAVVEEALARVDKSGDSHLARIVLLTMLSDSWEQDGNLLRAVAALEKAAGAVESALRSGLLAAAGASAAGMPVFRRGWPQDPAYLYHRLADLYRQIGRPQAAAEVTQKIRKLGERNPAALASFYERQGRLDEAAALYRTHADHLATARSDPRQIIAPLQSLSGIYQRQQRYADAADILKQAISIVQGSDRPDLRDQTFWLRQNLANTFQQAGETQAAEQIYQQLLADSQNSQTGLRLQVVTTYANHLGATKRGAQAEELLNNYLANQTNMQPHEQSSVLHSLSAVARMSGRTERADEYQRAALANQSGGEKRPSREVFIGSDLQKALSAANAEKFDEAVIIALQAMDAASLAVDREQVASRIPWIANALAARKAGAKADQLYQRLFSLLQTWSPDTLQPLITAHETHAQYLLQQRRWDDLHRAIEDYGNVLVMARGAGTGALQQVFRLKMEAARVQGSRDTALRAAQERRALEESLSGTTSERYLQALGQLAGAYELNCEPERAVPLHLQAIAIADIVYAPEVGRRASARMAAALAMARQRRFDEAESLSNEAVALIERTRSPQVRGFASELEQIRQIKTGSLQQGSCSETMSDRNPDGSRRWFDGSAPAQPRPNVPPQFNQ